MSTKLGKKSDKPIFKQIIDLIPSGLFRKCVSRHKSDKGSFRYFTYDQLVSTMFGQLNRCLSLREISLGIDQSPEFLADIGLQQSPAKSSMSYGNEKRNYRVFEDLWVLLKTHYFSFCSFITPFSTLRESLLFLYSFFILLSYKLFVCISIDYYFNTFTTGHSYPHKGLIIEFF